MSSIKTNVADYLTQIETLTNTNLQILKTLNDAFYTKKNHLYAEVDDTTYVIPSFLSLENKVNMLQENFENLIKSPETSEAYFNFNGNTRAIEVRKYSHAPDSIVLPKVSTYSVDSNDVFKDFMTPIPYVNFELPSLPNDIVEVNVKKIIPSNATLKELFLETLAYVTKDENGKEIKNYYTSANYTYSSMYKMLSNFTEDVDYVEYDTIYKLPIRKSIGKAMYVIEEVVDDIIDDDLNEIITLKLRNNLTDTDKFTNSLTYKLFDETIERPLKVGDQMVNYDGTGKVIIDEIRPLTNTIVVRVVNGEYLNFLGTSTYDINNDKDIHDFSKIRFFSPVNYNDDKYIKIPLEEDQFVFVAIAPLNSRMNIQAGWGTGLVMNTFALTHSSNSTPFDTYYNTNVVNIGDALHELTVAMASPITKLTKDEFNELTKFKPVINTENLKVLQINTHLNNSESAQNIRNAYDQKKNAEVELSDTQQQISDISAKLSTISFDDTSGTRAIYSSQLTELNEKKNELQTVIDNAIKTINLYSNSSEIPTTNAKYRIRGFYVPGEKYKNNVIGLNVQYRYKNATSTTGTATSITGENGQTYIYSDWNELNTTNKQRSASYDNGSYSCEYSESNETVNEPSYNQLDIPISQGESVDIRLQVIYDFGQPYVSVTSDWSEIVNIAFPSELSSDVSISKIIEENKSDYESVKFNGILSSTGISEHVSDALVDQNVTFYHTPDKIASGFYTAERRVIPLKDKLTEMSNDIANMLSTVTGANGQCKVSLVMGSSEAQLFGDRTNEITLIPYDNFSNLKNTTVGSYKVDNNSIVSTNLNIHIANTGKSVLKLYSMFPGNRDTLINDIKTSLFDATDYCKNENGFKTGVWYRYSADSLNMKSLQSLNQFITFRINNPYTGQEYYSVNGSASKNNLQNISGLDRVNVNTTDKIAEMAIYPLVSSKYGMCINSDDAISCLSINPGEEVIVPLYCEFKVNAKYGEITKTISFDLRTSLYTDPTNYTISVTAMNSSAFMEDFAVTTYSDNNNDSYNITV